MKSVPEYSGCPRAESSSSKVVDSINGPDIRIGMPSFYTLDIFVEFNNFQLSDYPRYSNICDIR